MTSVKKQTTVGDAKHLRLHTHTWAWNGRQVHTAIPKGMDPNPIPGPLACSSMLDANRKIYSVDANLSENKKEKKRNRWSRPAPAPFHSPESGRPSESSKERLFNNYWMPPQPLALAVEHQVLQYTLCCLH